MRRVGDVAGEVSGFTQQTLNALLAPKGSEDHLRQAVHLLVQHDRLSAGR